MDRTRRNTILALALPIIGGMTSQNILNLVDTAMVGAISASALAGVGIASFLHFMAIAGITGLSSAVQATAARRYGEANHHLAARPLNGGLLLSLVIGLPLGLTLYFLTPAIMNAMLDDPLVIEQGTPYLEIRLLAVWAVGMNFSFRGFWNGTNRSKMYLQTLLIMHLLNVPLNYVLIFGKFGFPEMGTAGAALGTVIATLIGTAIYFWLGMRHARQHAFLEAIPNFEQIKTLLRLGLPASIQQFFFAAGFTVLFWIIAQVGSDELAVSNVLINITLVAVLPALGLGMASASLVSQALGRGDADDAHRWAWDVVRVGAVIFIVLGGIMLCLPKLILAGFLHEPHLLELGAWPLRLVGLGILLDGTGLIMMQSLLGAGASATVMRIGVGLQWILFLPIAWILGPGLGFGLFTIWLAFMAYRSIQAGIFISTWQKRIWSEIKL